MRKYNKKIYRNKTNMEGLFKTLIVLLLTLIILLNVKIEIKEDNINNKTIIQLIQKKY